MLCLRFPFSLDWSTDRRSARFKHVARDDDAHDFIGAFEYLMNAQIAYDFLDAIVGEITVPAEELKGLVGNVESGIGDIAFCHSAEYGRIGFFGIERGSGAPKKGLRDFKLSEHIRDTELQRLKVCQRMAERLAFLDVRCSLVQSRARATERTSGDVQAAAIECGHCNLETVAL